MAHRHNDHEKKPLALFASPLVDHNEDIFEFNLFQTSRPPSTSGSQKRRDDEAVRTELGNVPTNATEKKDSVPSFHQHAEASAAELFFDLCRSNTHLISTSLIILLSVFVANLTTFTSLKEINSQESLLSYVGFFALLWLYWYSVSLYDVRFSCDSVFERCAKALHFGIMVGFAVVGPVWQPGRAAYSMEKYRVLSLILMVSRLVLAAQYAVTLWFVRSMKRTIVPLALIIASTLSAALIYGLLVTALPQEICDPVCKPMTTKIHIAWYIVSVAEVMITVGISCHWRVISFKGTHLVQRMSLLTLIILGEGIIVICKAISKIVKNGESFESRLTGQIVASVLLIYFCYMLYFDSLQEEHFGTIRQQWWASLHFPLHIALVLVLQGVSLLIMWLVAMMGLERIDTRFRAVETSSLGGVFANGTDFVTELRSQIDAYLWNTIPKGVDASSARDTWNSTLAVLEMAYESVQRDGVNQTAKDLISSSMNTAETVSIQTLFDSLGISVPKDPNSGLKKKVFDKLGLLRKYEIRFELVFDYVFLAAGAALLLMVVIGYLSLPASQSHKQAYIRLVVKAVVGVGVCLVCLVNTNSITQKAYMESAWMLPTMCIAFFCCVVATHVRPWHRKRE